MNFLIRHDVAKPDLPGTAQVVREARETLRDLRELRRLEIIVRRR